MSSRSERVKFEVIDSGAPLSSHSLNQRAVKRHLDGQRRVEGKIGESRKVLRAKLRRDRRAALVGEAEGESLESVGTETVIPIRGGFTIIL